MLELYMENPEIENIDEQEQTVEETNSYAEFIEHNFLNSFLSESTNEIFDAVNKLKFQNTLDYKDLTDVLVKLEAMDVSDITKVQVMEELTHLYHEWIEAESQVADHALLEYAGDPQKNKILRETMVEMEKAFNEYYKEVDFVISSLDEIHKIVSDAAKAKKVDAKAASAKVHNVYKKVDSALTTEDYKEYTRVYNTTFRKLANYCRKFSIKFNDVVMEDKKAFDKKLSAAAKKVSENDKFTAWLPSRDTGRTEKITSFNKALDDLRIDSKEATDNIIRDVQPIYNYGYSAMVYYIGNINYIRKVLGLEKENTVFYKILNKVIKTKKEDK